MTPLRQRFIEDLELRNLRENTKRAYVRAVAQFALFFGMSPELLGREQIREYLLYLIRDKKVSESTYRQVLSAIRFLYRTKLGTAQEKESVMTRHRLELADVFHEIAWRTPGAVQRLWA